MEDKMERKDNYRGGREGISSAVGGVSGCPGRAGRRRR